MLEDSDIKQIQGLINQAIKAREVSNAYGVNLVAYHTHNGIDASLIDRINNKLVSATFAAAAPTVTPLAIGDVFVRTDTKKVYVATGVSSSSDWTLVN